MRYTLLLLSFAVSLAFPGLPSSENLIVNGSFEESSVNPGSYQDLPAGSTAIKGWTVTLNHIDYINASLWWTAVPVTRAQRPPASAASSKHSQRCQVRSTTSPLTSLEIP